MRISKNAAYGLMAMSAVLWATNGTFTSLAFEGGATAMQVSVFATVLTGAILVILIAVLDPAALKIRKGDFWPFFVFSLITGAFFALAWYICVDLTGVATAVILLYLYPSIVTIASLFLLHEKLTAQKALALPLTFIGCVLVAGAQEFEEGISFNTIGVLLGLYTAFAGAVYYLWGKKFLDSGYSPNTVILYMTILSLPVLVILANPFELVKIDMTAAAWANIIAIAVLPGTIAFVASMVALNHLEASKASILASIEPVAAVVIAYLVLAEVINGLQILGVVLVFVGVVLLRLTIGNKKGVAPEESKGLILEK